MAFSAENKSLLFGRRRQCENYRSCIDAKNATYFKRNLEEVDLISFLVRGREKLEDKRAL